jgi:hypothetical protein
MQSFFTFLQANPFFLLFFVVGLAVWIGRASPGSDSRSASGILLTVFGYFAMILA